MQPLTDTANLRREGKVMGNCVANHAPDVQDGTVYVYHWAGEEPATVMLEDDAERGWTLVEALGAYNEILSPWTRYLIEGRIWLWRFHLLGVRGDPAPRIPELPCH